jgi:LemA protein
MVLIVIGVLVVIGVVLAALYNGLVRSKIRVDEAWSDITVQLKRRADLIPNLINTVKGYAKHESSVFEAITAARAQTISAADQGPAASAKAEGGFQAALKSLFAVAEAYPDLKASENFQQLQAELTDTEDKIQASRRFYNGAVRDYNTKRTVFPTNMIASSFGFKEDRDFYELDEAEKAAVQKPVDVQF